MSVLTNISTGQQLSRSVVRAYEPWSRCIGLIGRASIAPDEGMWFDGCGSIHTLGMRVPIDVVFLDERRRVVGMRHCVAANSIYVAQRNAVTVLEMGSGFLLRHDIVDGDRFVLSEGAELYSESAKIFTGDMYVAAQDAS